MQQLRRLVRRGAVLGLLALAGVGEALAFWRAGAPLSAAGVGQAEAVTLALADHWARVEVTEPAAVEALAGALAAARLQALGPPEPSIATPRPAGEPPNPPAVGPPGAPQPGPGTVRSGVPPFEGRRIRISVRLPGGRTAELEYDPRAFVLRWQDRTLDPSLAAVRLLERYRREILSLVRGEIVTWEVVDQLFPRNASARVVDAVTGETFELYRRGGTAHADVEPLDGDDAQVLRGLVGGDWSWSRRPVFLLVDGRRIAASINAMPHGRESVTENEFAGHHCLHVLFSRLHKNQLVDARHLLMILAAAGIPVDGAISYGDPGLDWYKDQTSRAACHHPD